MPADEDNPPDGLSVNPDKWGYRIIAGQRLYSRLSPWWSGQIFGG
jgi:hypothetical protein